MNGLSINHDHAGITREELATIAMQLAPEIERVAAARRAQYDTPYASVNLPWDTELRESVYALAGAKQNLNPTMMIVIGIGGSNLGSMAVYEAIQGLLSNEFNPCKLYYADTVDSGYISKLLALADQRLTRGEAVLLTIVSKSGTTTETIANAQVFIELLAKHMPHEYHHYIVTITDHNSPLWLAAQDHGWDRLAIPEQVGGRYSVLSAVGLFPLAMLGIDIEQLAQGAAQSMQACMSSELAKNPAALSAALLYAQHKKGIIIHDTFVSAKRLAGLGAWYRQLLAESIGKAESTTGVVINEGITPTVSVGSIDLHSIAQLHLGGPYDKFTSFILVEKPAANCMVPKNTPLSDCAPSLAGKSFNHIMSAIIRGTQKAYADDGRPFLTLLLAQLNEYCLGQLIQAKMVEIMYLGFLLEVNPFDQPQVELYKKETREILSS